MILNKLANEKSIFYATLALCLILLLSVKFYPSMDGPCHLYNSNLICNLLNSNSSDISTYFQLNKAIIPNWTCYIILSLFNFFLPAWVAEKILLILYLFGITISFRLLITQLCQSNASLSILIIPFAYSSLFHLGFYNYCLSFIFLFFTIYYWLKNYESNNPRKYLVLFLLITFTYLSALLTFVFLVFILGLFIILFSFQDYYKKYSHTLISKKILRELISLFTISLPSLVFSIIFIRSTIFSSSSEHYSFGELIKWLNQVHCLIAYDYAGEERITGQFLHIAIAIISIAFYIRVYKKDSLLNMDRIRKSDIFIIPTLLALLFFFIVPNGSNAGMMSDRLCLLAYLFFIVWVSSQHLPQRINLIFVVLIVMFQVGLLFKRQNGKIRSLNKDATAIYNASKYIEERSIVLPVNMSDDWIEPHFSNYLGIEKTLILLENYEATVSWFPIQWNLQQMPRIKLGEFDEINGIHWKSNTLSIQIKPIDYVFLYGIINKINDLKWGELKTELCNHYRLVYNSENNYIAIYKRI